VPTTPSPELSIVTVHEASAVVRPQRFQEMEQALLAEGVQMPSVRRLKRLLEMPRPWTGRWRGSRRRCAGPA
jgi:hypothetical protein